MLNIQNLLGICVELAKASNPALATVGKALISEEHLQAPFPTLAPGDLCIFTYKHEGGQAAQAGRFGYANEDELVFGQVGNIAGHTWRVWRGQPALAVIRVAVVAAPELDRLPAGASRQKVKKQANSLRTDLNFRHYHKSSKIMPGLPIT